MTWIEITALIASGLLAGFVNTLAGGGTIISLSILMFLGLPANIANGTNRIAILAQTFTAVKCFRQQKLLLDEKKGIALGIPSVLGSVVGAFIAVDLDEKVIEKAIAVAMLLMSVFIIFKPRKWLKGQPELMGKPVSILNMVIFFFIGVYGGFIHAGVGYLLLAGIVFGAGFDLIKANAVKNLIVLLYAPFILGIFIWMDQVNFKYGIILSLGNISGAYFATRFAIKKGSNFVRWFIVFIIFITCAHLFGLIDFKVLISSFLK